MSDQDFEYDEFIAPGVVEKVLEDALRSNRRKGKICEPYHCTVPGCQRMTDNSPYNGVCRSCQEKNTTNDPFWIVSRVMGWLSNTPADLMEVLMTSIAVGDEEPRHRTAPELVDIAHTPEGQDILAELWDNGTRYPALTTVQTTVQVPNPRLPEGFDFERKWVILPEEQWVYNTRPRPKTRNERAAVVKAGEEFYVLDRERIEEAKRSAILKQLEAAYAQAQKAGVDTSDIIKPA